MFQIIPTYSNYLELTEFVIVFEDLTYIKHLKNNVFSLLMVNLTYTEKSFVKWTHHFLPYGFALNVTQMNSKNPELDGTISPIHSLLRMNIYEKETLLPFSPNRSKRSSWHLKIYLFQW